MDIWATFSDEIFGNLRGTTFPVAAARFGFAMALGAVIGWEREATARAAGLRTHMLICLASCMFTMLALELTYFSVAGDTGAEVKVNPIDVIAAITSGVAFLAAGSIFTSGGSVRGLTTGATMWLCGAIGVCCGTGDVALGVSAAVMGLVVLVIIGRLKPRGPASDR